MQNNLFLFSCVLLLCLCWWCKTRVFLSLCKKTPTPPLFAKGTRILRISPNGYLKQIKFWPIRGSGPTPHTTNKVQVTPLFMRSNKSQQIRDRGSVCTYIYCQNQKSIKGPKKSMCAGENTSSFSCSSLSSSCFPLLLSIFQEMGFFVPVSPRGQVVLESVLWIALQFAQEAIKLFILLLLLLSCPASFPRPFGPVSFLFILDSSSLCKVIVPHLNVIFY